MSEVPHPKPETRNPRPESRIPKPQIPNPKPQSQTPNPQTRDQGDSALDHALRWMDDGGMMNALGNPGGLVLKAHRLLYHSTTFFFFITLKPRVE